MTDVSQRSAASAPRPSAPSPVCVRALRRDDLDDVIRLDALHTGESKPAYWREVFDGFLAPERSRLRVGLAAVDESVGGACAESGTEFRPSLLGYLLGEVRAFEFGSEACGWIFAVGVDPRAARDRVASTLLAESCRRFHEAGVETIRTMVPRANVPVLSFFRANGFVAGSFVQLELDLEETR